MKILFFSDVHGSPESVEREMKIIRIDQNSLATRIHEFLAEHAVVRVRGKQRRLVVAEMRQPVGRHRIAAEMLYQPADFYRRPSHQRAF